MTHPSMAMSLDECVHRTTIANKITAIIPTFNSPLQSIILSTLALLLRSKDSFEHICVCINGPDERTGSEALQNQKQKFLEDLRELSWRNRAMPITIIRAWSRIGQAEAMEMALPWIHTAGYLILSDNSIVNDSYDDLRGFFEDDDVALGTNGSPIAEQFHNTIIRGMYTACLPTLRSDFLVCKKKLIMLTGSKWKSYDAVPRLPLFMQFYADDLPQEFKDFHGNPLRPIPPYNYVKSGFGAWVNYGLRILNKKSIDLGVRHSTINPESIRLLESEIEQYPEYHKLYLKFKDQ